MMCFEQIKYIHTYISWIRIWMLYVTYGLFNRYRDCNVDIAPKSYTMIRSVLYVTMRSPEAAGCGDVTGIGWRQNTTSTTSDDVINISTTSVPGWMRDCLRCSRLNVRMARNWPFMCRRGVIKPATHACLRCHSNGCRSRRRQASTSSCASSWSLVWYKHVFA